MHFSANPPKCERRGLLWYIDKAPTLCDNTGYSHRHAYTNRVSALSHTTKTNNTVIVVILAYAIFIVLGIPSGLLGVAWPSMSQDFARPLDALGILLLASTLGYLLASFFNGRVIARLGIANTLIASTLLASIGMLGYAVTQNWWLIIPVATFTGLGNGTIDAGLNLHFARHYSPRLMNWLHAAFGVGAVIGPIVMTTLISQELSWRWGYALMAVLQLLGSISVLLTRARWDIPAPLETDEAKPKVKDYTLLQSLRQPLVLLGAALFFVYAGIEITAGQWTYSLFTEGRGIDISTAGLWVSIYWATFTLGRIVFGFIADRIPLAPTIRLCMLAVTGGTLMMLNTNGETMTFLGLAIAGFALAPIFPLLISATPDRLGEAHATNAIGFQVAAAGLGIGVMPGLAGVLASSFGLEAIVPYLVIVSVFMLVLYQIIATRKIKREDELSVPLVSPEF